MFKQLLCASAVALAATGAWAEGWVLNADASHVAYGSIKKNAVGEVNGFERLSGSVSNDGQASIEIDLTSVQTWIDVRNERMLEHVFNNVAKATITAQIDMAAVSGLGDGETTVLDTTATLNLLGKDIPVETELFVARLTDTRVLVTTANMIMLSTADAGIDGGIDALKEIAKLPGITRVAPVTLRLVFDSDGDQASATPAAAETTVVATSGDAAKGKKVFRACKACHALEAGKKKTGPHLEGIIGRKAASVEGFRYSKAFKALELVWTEETLAAYLADPKGYVKGTKMSYRGLKNEAKMADLLAYLSAGE